MFAWLRLLLIGEGRILDQLDRIVQLIRETSMSNQDQINALSDQLGTATDGLRSDIQALKDQVAAGTPAENLDFSSLDARVDALSALDAENPTPAASGDPVV